MKILIADDSPKNRDLLSSVLGHLGHEVVEACDGRDAVEQASHVEPAVVILDLQMPVMDGFDAARQLRSDPRFHDTPILALTAYAMDGDREKAFAAGFTAYLTKPIALGRLREELARCLQSGS